MADLIGAEVSTQEDTVNVQPVGALKFPYPNHKRRLQDYEYYQKLFLGQHWEAFNIRADDPNFTKQYAQLRYVMVNFAGLISKVIADFLFSETPKFTVEDGDQEFLDALIEDNNLHVQNYESSLSNSYLGDALYKLRVGKRNPNDAKATIIIEDITPTIYFPKVDGWNVRSRPEEEELAWTFEIASKKYLRKEIHSGGMIRNEVYLMEGEEIKAGADLSILGIPGLTDEVITGVNRSLLFHSPNWKTGNRYFGISDYYDLDTLFFAVNNRMTKSDNILDKHSDPILLVPEGILDKDGKVKKRQLGVIEIKEGENAKPEYVVWDASLENAFKEIDKLVEFLFMVSETSPDILGMGQGQSDSGRALKLKIMRTIAKAARKRLYYDMMLKDVLFTAQELAKAWNVEVRGKKLTTDPVRPQIEWHDGLPIDESEQVETEVKRVDAGLTTVADSLKRIDGVDDKEAEEKAKEIKEENKIEMPESKMGKDLLTNKALEDKKVNPNAKMQ